MKKGTKKKSFKEIRAVLLEHKQELKEKYGVSNIGIFGSYVRNENRKSSDIDILVELLHYERSKQSF